MTIEKINQTITDIRLETYKRSFQTKDDLECLGVYIWNKRVCAELLPVLQILEVSLRNAICNSHKDWARVNSPEYRELTDDEFLEAYDSLWFATFYDSSTDDKFSQSKNQIDFAKKKLERKHIDVTKDSLIPELSFGIWTSICKDHHESKENSMKLWPSMMHYTFPGYNISYNTTCSLLSKVNDLRNRIAHHEPIWHSKSLMGMPSFLNKVIDEYDNCLNFIKAIQPSNLKVIELALCHKNLESLLTLDAIKKYKEIAKELNNTTPINNTSWKANSSLENSITGEIKHISGQNVTVRDTDRIYDCNFKIDHQENVIKRKLSSLKIGQKITFVPRRKGHLFLATKVKPA